MKFKILNWNVKLWAVVGVLIVVLAGTGVYMTGQNSDEADTAIVLARANTEGSGIYGVSTDMVTFDENGHAMLVADEWKGKVAATPGPTSIQHMILKEALTRAGLDVIMYNDQSPPTGNQVALLAVKPFEMADKFDILDSEGNRLISGGIVWQSVYSDVIHKSSAVHLCWSNNIEGYENHACCMLAGNSHYLETHDNATVRFLAGYIKSVKFINEAKELHSGEDFEELISICKTAGNTTREVAIEALDSIKYTYDLTNFNSEYVNLINAYIESGNISQLAVDAVKSTPEEFAKNHINDELLNKAKNIGDEGSYPLDTIRVAYLVNDLHQVALHVGVAKGFFKEYNLNVELLPPMNVGGAVVDALLTGQADLGFAGAPPIVMKSFNNYASR